MVLFMCSLECASVEVVVPINLRQFKMEEQMLHSTPWDTRYSSEEELTLIAMEKCCQRKVCVVVTKSH